VRGIFPHLTIILVMQKKFSRRRNAPAQGVLHAINAASSPDEVDEILSGGEQWTVINEGIRRERKSLARSGRESGMWLDGDTARALLRIRQCPDASDELGLRIQDLFVDQGLPFIEDTVENVFGEEGRISHTMVDGMLGVADSVDSFDPFGGESFTSVAARSVVRSLAKGVEVSREDEHGAFVRGKIIRRLRDEIEAKTGSAPSIGEVAGILEFEPSDVLEALGTGGTPESPEDEALYLVQAAGDPAQILTHACKHLDPRSWLVFKLAAGVGTKRQGGYAVAEIAENIGVSSDEALKILTDAGTKLKRYVAKPVSEVDAKALDHRDVGYFENTMHHRLFNNLESRARFRRYYAEFVKTGDIESFIPAQIGTRGDRFMFLRTLNGLSQSELSRRTGVGRSAAVGYEADGLDYVTGDEVLGSGRSVQRTIGNLGKILTWCGFEGGVAKFLWNKTPKQCLADWGVSEPGAKLRVSRRLSGKTTKDVSDATGISRVVIEQYERGALSGITREELCKDNTQVVKTIRRVGAVLNEVGFDGEVSEFLFGRKAVDAPTRLGIRRHQGRRFRVLRRLHGVSGKELKRDIGVTHSTLARLDAMGNIVSPDVTRPQNKDQVKVKTMKRVLDHIGCDAPVSKVLFNMDLDRALDKIPTSACGKLRLLRILAGKNPEEFTQANAETVRSYEEGELDLLGKGMILKPRSKAVQLVKSLSMMLSELGYDKTAAEFLWHKKPCELPAEWGIALPGEKMRVTRVASGITLQDVMGETGISSVGLDTCENKLEPVSVEDVARGEGSRLMVLSIRNIPPVLDAIGYAGGVSRLFWEKSSQEVLSNPNLTLLGRVRVVQFLSGMEKWGRQQFIRYLKRTGVEAPGDVALDHLKHLEHVHDLGVKAGCVASWSDFFPGRSNEEVLKVLAGRQAEYVDLQRTRYERHLKEVKWGRKS